MHFCLPPPHCLCTILTLLGSCWLQHCAQCLFIQMHHTLKQKLFTDLAWQPSAADKLKEWWVGAYWINCVWELLGEPKKFKASREGPSEGDQAARDFASPPFQTWKRNHWVSQGKKRHLTLRVNQCFDDKPPISNRFEGTRGLQES